jgi:hypothetical protein
MAKCLELPGICSERVKNCVRADHQLIKNEKWRQKRIKKEEAILKTLENYCIF